MFTSKPAPVPRFATSNHVCTLAAAAVTTAFDERRATQTMARGVPRSTSWRC